MRLFFLIFSFFILSNYAQAKTHQIEMLNFKDGESMVFYPAYIKVDIGDEIHFVAKDSGHNSISIYTPKDAKTWKGKNNKDVKVKLNKEGIYIYECSNHRIMSMIGIIQVGDAVNKDDAQKFINEYKKKLKLNKERIDTYFSKIQ